MLEETLRQESGADSCNISIEGDAPIRRMRKRKKTVTIDQDEHVVQTEPPPDVILHRRPLTSRTRVGSSCIEEPAVGVPKEPDLSFTPSPVSVVPASHLPSLSSVRLEEFSTESVPVTLFHSSLNKMPLNWEFRVHTTTVRDAVHSLSNC